MTVSSVFLIIISAIFINNFVLSKFLGICPFIGVSKKIDSSLGMGIAVIFVMTMASAITWIINKYLLTIKINGVSLEYMNIVVFILVIATVVQIVEMIIKKVSKKLYKSLGIFLPLITTNCAVLGAALLAIEKNMSFLETIINGAASGIGFSLALILMAGIRERLRLTKVPEKFVGLPITFITAAILALSFSGFSGMKF